MGPGVRPRSLPGSRLDVDLGPRPWTYVWEKEVACLLRVGRQVPRCPGARDDGQRVLLALTAPHPWGMLDVTGGSPGSRALVFSHFIKISS